MLSTIKDQCQMVALDATVNILPRISLKVLGGYYGIAMGMSTLPLVIHFLLPSPGSLRVMLDCLPVFFEGSVDSSGRRIQGMIAAIVRLVEKLARVSIPFGTAVPRHQ